jgi:hypothetical protein
MFMMDQRSLTRLSNAMALFLIAFMLTVLIADIRQYSQLSSSYSKQVGQETHLRIDTNLSSAAQIASEPNREELKPIATTIAAATPMQPSLQETKPLSAGEAKPDTPLTNQIEILPKQSASEPGKRKKEEFIMNSFSRVDPQNNEVEDPSPVPQVTPPAHVVKVKQKQEGQADAATPMPMPVLSASDDVCKMIKNHMSYLTPRQSTQPPAVLYSFPGAGSIFTRLLIEYSFGIYSSTLHRDPSLSTTFPADGVCNASVSVLEAFNSVPLKSLISGDGFIGENQKCKKFINKITRMILLIRDPYEAIWAEFQHRVTKSFTTSVPKADFSQDRWNTLVSRLTYSYLELVTVQYREAEKLLPDTIHYVKYEDFWNDNQKFVTLRKLARFLSLPPSVPGIEVVKRLSCAFALAKKAYASIEIQVNPDKHITKDSVYTKNMVCSMWKVFGNSTMKYGYRPYGGHDCSDSDVSVLAPA